MQPNNNVTTAELLDWKNKPIEKETEKNLLRN